VSRNSDPNPASRFELLDQLIHSGGGLLPADIVLVDQYADDLSECAPRLDQIPDAGTDIRQPVIHAVAQAEDHDLVAEPCRQLVGADDGDRVRRKRLGHRRSVSHGAAGVTAW
jgi:hypothetical protein